MRLWLSHNLNRLLYVRLLSCVEKRFATSDGMNVRFYVNAKNNSVVKAVIERSNQSQKTGFADTYPVWPFIPSSSDWRELVKHASLEPDQDVPSYVDYGFGRCSLKYHPNGDSYSENFDGETFTIPRNSVIEIAKEIDLIEG
ncbi:hypothetical protein [Roseobacter fucihabitans]|uniref:hypothetical protein n=1 Tax=Roseobacter fucihabitans TaxID=1537242 RepID=UPI001CA34FD9|nr:hypothetical protein [Roseobacter litoralis]